MSTSDAKQQNIPSERAQHPSKAKDDQDFNDDGTVAEGTESKGTEETNTQHAPPRSAQSETVNKILAEADEQVKSRGMTDHPETEPANKKIIEEELAKKNAKSQHEEHKEHLSDKIKGILHHEKS